MTPLQLAKIISRLMKGSLADSGLVIEFDELGRDEKRTLLDVAEGLLFNYVLTPKSAKNTVVIVKADRDEFEEQVSAYRDRGYYDRYFNIVFEGGYEYRAILTKESLAAKRLATQRKERNKRG